MIVTRGVNGLFSVICTRIILFNIINADIIVYKLSKIKDELFLVPY